MLNRLRVRPANEGIGDFVKKVFGVRDKPKPEEKKPEVYTDAALKFFDLARKEKKKPELFFNELVNKTLLNDEWVKANLSDKPSKIQCSVAHIDGRMISDTSVLTESLKKADKVSIDVLKKLESNTTLRKKLINDLSLLGGHESAKVDELWTKNKDKLLDSIVDYWKERGGKNVSGILSVAKTSTWPVSGDTFSNEWKREANAQIDGPTIDTAKQFAKDIKTVFQITMESEARWHDNFLVYYDEFNMDIFDEEIKFGNEIAENITNSDEPNGSVAEPTNFVENVSHALLAAMISVIL